MAEIKVNIKGDDSDLKNKFRESSEDARVFAASVQKSLEAIQASSKTLVSDTGLGGVAKLLGGAGMIGAAEALTSKIIDGFKGAVTAALDFGKQVGQLRSALGPTFGGQAEYWANQVRGISGAMGSFESSLKTFQGLVRGGMMPQDAYTALINIQNAAKATGIDFDQLGDKFAEMKERGEVPERFFREFPQLSPAAQRLGGGERPTADWMFKTLLPGIAPGGLQAPIRLAAEQSTRGQLAGLQEEMNKRWIELGQDLLPIVNAALRELNAQMPEVTKDFQLLGEELGRATPQIVNFLHEFFGTGERLKHPQTPFGRAIKSTDDFFANIENAFTTIFKHPMETLQDAAKAHKEASEAIIRMQHPR